MEQLIICETDRGRYAVRPMDWAGIWNEKGQIKEHLNHLALFVEKEDAEKFVKWKGLEEQGKLLRLPCKVGDTLYFPYIDDVTKEKVISEEEVTEIGLYYRVGNGELSSCKEIGDIIFTTQEQSELALKEMEGENE